MFSEVAHVYKQVDKGIPSLVINLTPSVEVIETAPMGYNPAMSSFSPSPQSTSPLAPAGLPSFARRHSYNVAATKPLRSSPLAGPALSSDGSVAEEARDRQQAPRVGSTPDLAISLTPLPAARRSRPKSSQGFIPVLSPASTGLSDRAENEATSPDSPSRHSFFLGLEKRRVNRKSVHSPIEVPPVACPPVPEWALQERINSAERRPAQTRAAPLPRPKSFHASSVAPLDPTNASDKNSWLTTNPYDATPRFSRLGLSASNVVLPVSAREHKRMSRASSSNSIRSAFTVTPTTGAQGIRTRPESPTSLSRSSTSSNFSSRSHGSPYSTIPSLSLTRSSSNASSNESILTPPTPMARSLAPSIASSSDIGTIAEEEDPQPDTRRFSLKRIRKNSVARMKSLRLKPSKSHSDIHADLQVEPYEHGADHRRTYHHRNNAIAAPPPLPDLKAFKSSVTVLHQPVHDEKLASDAAIPGTKSIGRKGTIKKLLKTFGWSRT